MREMTLSQGGILYDYFSAGAYRSKGSKLDQFQLVKASWAILLVYLPGIPHDLIQPE